MRDLRETLNAGEKDAGDALIIGEGQMFSKSGELYDKIYGAFKNYDKEAQSIADLINRVRPGAKTLLDVGCGTGQHAHFLTRKHGFSVDGVDLDPGLIKMAYQKHISGKFVVGDMASFELGKKYDAVLCLFSSIGYLKTTSNVQKALLQFKKHLEPDGVVIVEPWFAPENWTAGKVYLKTYEDDELKVCRISHSTKVGDISVLKFHYLIGTSEGITNEIETHELGLFTVNQMMECFRSVGLEAEYDQQGLTDRGLYVARCAS